MSDTPETDAAQIREAETRWSVGPLAWPLVPADFARRLERQRDELAAALRELVRIEYGPVEGLFRWRAAMDQAVALLARIEEGESTPHIVFCTCHLPRQKELCSRRNSCAVAKARIEDGK